MSFDKVKSFNFLSVKNVCKSLLQFYEIFNHIKSDESRKIAP